MPALFTQDRLVLGLAVLLYGLAFVSAGISLLRKRRYLRSVLFLIVLAAWAIQTAGLSLRGYQVHACPLGNPFEILHFLSWSAVGVFVILFPLYRLNLLGFFCAGLAFLLGLGAFLPGFDRPYTGGLFGGNPWIELHAALAIFSYGLFGLLALISGMFLLQQHGLKHKRTAGFFKYLASIRQLDQAALRLLTTAVATLTVAILVGSIYWIPNLAQVSAPKLVFTLLLWAAYTTLTVLRLTQKCAGRSFALACLLLFLLALGSLWPIDSSRRRAPELAGCLLPSASALPFAMASRHAPPPAHV